MRRFKSYEMENEITGERVLVDSLELCQDMGWNGWIFIDMTWFTI